MDSKFHVFLSHNSADKPAVEQIAERLRQENIEPWFDKWSLVPGKPWQPAIEEALKQCDACAVFIGPGEIGPWQNEEMRVAINRRVTEQKFPVIPVLLPGAERGKRSALPPFLTNVTWVEFYKTLADELAFHRLICGIRDIPPGQGPIFERYAGICPYKGLRVFDVGDSPFFFGRKVLTEWLISDLRHILTKHEARFLAIIGASGSGKSSLARAGLLAKLKKGALEGSEGWPQVIIKPGANPVENLAIGGAEILGLPQDAASLHREFMMPLLTDPGLLNRQARLALRNAPSEHRVLLLVDQFEELFTLCSDDSLRHAFISNLLHAASSSEGSIIVVITLRADFVGKCASHPELATFLSDSQELVGPMTDAELLEAIEQPAYLSSCEFEPGLVKTLFDDIKAQPGGLPLLQHALLELWNGRQGRRLTHETYVAIGKIEGALAKRADLVYDGFTKPQKLIAKRVFLRLTQPGEGTEDTRRRASFAELVTSPGETEQVEALVQELAREDVRLLVTEGDRLGQTIDIAHEALIRGWPRLRQWIDESREGLREHRRLTIAAEEWQRLQQDESALYRGLRLEQAQNWRKAQESELNELERAFLDKSLERRKQEEADSQRLAEEREAQRQRELGVAHQLAEEAEARRAAQEEKGQQQRRANKFLWIGTSVAISLTILAVGFAIYAFNQQRKAEQQKRSALAGKLSVVASDLATRNPIQGLLLATQATYFQPMAEVKENLSKILRANSSLLTSLGGHQDAVWDFALSPDGKLLASGSGDSTIRLWDVASRQPVCRPLTGHTEGVDKVAFSTDGKLLASASSGDKTVRLWDVATCKPIAEPLQGEDIAFNPAGKILAIVNDKTIRLWDVVSRQPLGEPLTGLTDIVSAVVFSPDGKLLASGGADKVIHLWDVATQKPIEALQGSKDRVRGLTFSPNGQVLVSSSSVSINLWNMASRQLLGELPVAKLTAGGEVLFSPDGKLVATPADDFSIRLWDVESKLPIGEPLRGHENQVEIIAFNPDGKLLASGSLDGTIRLWDLATSESVATLRGHERDVYDIAFIQNGRYLVSTGFDGTIRFWDGSSRLTLNEPLQGHDWPVTAVTFTPDGKSLVSASDDATLRIWDVDSKLPVGDPLRGHSQQIKSIAVSPDGKWLASASNRAREGFDQKNKHSTTLLWDIQSRKSVGGPMQGSSVAFSPDSKLLALASDDNVVHLLDVASQRPVREPLRGHKGIVNGMAFSPDNKLLASASVDKTIRLWDVATGQPFSEPLTGHRASIDTATFGPDGKFLASAGEDKTVRLWDMASQKSIGKPLPGHAAAISPDGKLLALATKDNAIRLWDVASQKPFGERLRGHTDTVNSVAFSPDGRVLASASSDKTIRLWETNTVTIKGSRQRACQMVGRNLDLEEWQEYVGAGEPYQKTCSDLPCPADMDTKEKGRCILKPADKTQ